MFKLQSLACGTVGLVASALLMLATLAPVPAAAGAQGQPEYATLCTDVLAGITTECLVSVA